MSVWKRLTVVLLVLVGCVSVIGVECEGGIFWLLLFVAAAIAWERSTRRPLMYISIMLSVNVEDDAQV